MFRPRDCEGKLAVKVFCLFYGKKYPYSNVLKLEKEFKRYGVDFYCHTDLKDEQYHLSGIKEHWHKIRFFDSNFTKLNTSDGYANLLTGTSTKTSF